MKRFLIFGSAGTIETVINVIRRAMLREVLETWPILEAPYHKGMQN